MHANTQFVRNQGSMDTMLHLVAPSENHQMVSHVTCPVLFLALRFWNSIPFTWGLILFRSKKLRALQKQELTVIVLRAPASHPEAEPKSSFRNQQISILLPWYNILLQNIFIHLTSSSYIWKHLQTCSIIFTLCPPVVVFALGKSKRRQSSRQSVSKWRARAQSLCGSLWERKQRKTEVEEQISWDQGQSEKRDLFDCKKSTSLASLKKNVRTSHHLQGWPKGSESVADQATGQSWGSHEVLWERTGGGEPCCYLFSCGKCGDL